MNSELLQSRGNDILGVSDGINADDDLPYATINYANGPGHRANTNQNGIRNDLLKTDMHANVSVIYAAIRRVFYTYHQSNAATLE